MSQRHSVEVGDNAVYTPNLDMEAWDESRVGAWLAGVGLQQVRPEAYPLKCRCHKSR